MDIASLESFVLFSKLGSFSKVAEQRCRTNAAISAQMKKLEEQYNAQLFEKKGRNIELTPAGTELLYFAKYILELNHEAKSRLQGKGDVAELVIGSPSDYVTSFLLSLVDHLSSTLPKIQIKLIISPSSKLREMWKSNEVDIALISSITAAGDGTLVGPIKGAWVASANYDSEEHPRLSVILYDESCAFHQQAIVGLREKGTDFLLHSTTSDSHTMCHLVENRGVVAAMAEVSMRPTMKQVVDSRLPALPTVYLKLLTSERLKNMDTANLVRVLQALTPSLSAHDLDKIESSQCR